MKIAFFMATILEHGGGLEKYLIETAAAMSERSGITADIITMDNDFTDRITSGLSVFYMKKIDKKLSHKEDLANIKRRLGKATYYKAHSLKELRSLLNNYDVIYSKNELLESFLFKFVIGYRKVPPIVFGGHTPLRYPVAESFHAKLHNKLYGGFLYKFLAAGVHAFHTLNTYEAGLYGKLFPQHKVAKIYNPFDINMFKRNAQKDVYKLDSTEGNIRILWVGRLTEQKGVHDLVDIIQDVNANLGTQQNRVSWHIFGDGELRPIVKNLVRKQRNVTFHGHTDQKYMASVYAQHDMFLSTSKWEGYPYTLIEPQAFGLQAFAYRIPGATDILEAYTGGNLADDKAHMMKLLVNQLRKHLEAGQVPRYQASSQFEPSSIYKQLVQLLSKGAA